MKQIRLKHSDHNKHCHLWSSGLRKVFDAVIIFIVQQLADRRTIAPKSDENTRHTHKRIEIGCVTNWKNLQTSLFKLIFTLLFSKRSIFFISLYSKESFSIIQHRGILKAVCSIGFSLQRMLNTVPFVCVCRWTVVSTERYIRSEWINRGCEFPN